MYAKRGSGKAWMQPLIRGNVNFESQYEARLVQVSSVDDPALATFCEPVEKANSNQSFAAGLAHSVGLRFVSFDLFQLVVTLGLVIDMMVVSI